MCVFLFLFYFILFYFILFYFILFFILFYFILFYFILFYFTRAFLSSNAGRKDSTFCYEAKVILVSVSVQHADTARTTQIENIH